MLEHASRLELLWTTLAIVGVTMSVRGLWDAYTDAVTLKASGRNGDGRIIAHQVFRNEGVRLVMLVAFVAIGLAAMGLPNQPADPRRAFVAIGFLTMEVVLVYGTFADRRDTKKLLAVRPQNERKGDP